MIYPLLVICATLFTISTGVSAREKPENGTFGNQITEFFELGTYNGRSWYIDGEARHHEASNNWCQRFGWLLAEFQSQDEIDWVLTRTGGAATYMWTGGVNLDDRRGFYWGVNSGSGVASDIRFHGYEFIQDGLGLALSFARQALVTKNRITELPYLCTSTA